MQKKLLGYVPYGTFDSRTPAYPFQDIFTPVNLAAHNCIYDIRDMDAVIVWGGADISCTIYNQVLSAHRSCSASKLSVRDEVELTMVNEAIKNDIPIIGICRGAQLVCAVAGGTLVQHVSDHSRGDHSILTHDGQELVTSSVHHQMMYPFEVPHEMLAWASEALSDGYHGQGHEMLDLPVEPEVVWFPTIRALAVQGHPEFMEKGCAFNNWVREQIGIFILEKETAENGNQDVHA